MKKRRAYIKGGAPATYRYRDPAKRREQCREAMKRYRAKQKEKGNG